MASKRRKKRKPQNHLLVLRLLILVVVVLAIFEGRLIFTMFTHRSGSSQASSQATEQEPVSEAAQAESDQGQSEDGKESGQTGGANSVADAPLAGLSAWYHDNGQEEQVSQETEDPYRVSEEIDSPIVVKKAEPPVDDSYFSDAVFIGDSRMEGFRNSSGITQGDFLTSVGLSTDRMSEQTIATAEGTISVYQGLSGKQYNKIYLMLGTNDLGYYPWEEFPVNFKNVLEQFHQLQPNAMIYVCSVIYVEEAKITTSYDNNDNVRKINGYLVDVCEELDYCYYLNLNEIFSNGYGSLIEGASSDGVHLYEIYCEQMLDYLKNHYVDVPAPASAEPEAVSEAETETEADTGTGSDNA